MRKMNFSGVTIVSLFFALLIFAPRMVSGQVDASELKKFQGTWKMEKGEMDGKSLNIEHVKKSIMYFNGTKVKLFVPHQHKDTIISQVTKIDLSKDPMVIYWLRENGPNTGKTMPAIYKFEGNDKLHICFDPTLVTTPKKFGTDVGSGHIWQTWTRVK